MLSFFQLLGGNPVPFAVVYHRQRAVALSRAGGAERQLRNMTAATRWVAA